jgi:ribosomal protein S18 acetylase RimI-like enzyme
MSPSFTIREYKSTDQEEILNLLRLNTPIYFSLEEEPDLIYYLQHEIDFYFVIEINGMIVGSGGINFNENKTLGKISWDILHPDFQGKKLGSALLKYRIEKLKQVPEVKEIIVRTSQLVYQFYEKNGFQLIEIIEHYWAKNFHLYKMKYVN